MFSKKIVLFAAAATAVCILFLFCVNNLATACNCDELTITKTAQNVNCSGCVQSAGGNVSCSASSQGGNYVCVSIWYQQSFNICDESVYLFDGQNAQQCVSFQPGDTNTWYFTSGRNDWSQVAGASIYISFPCTDKSKAQAVVWWETCGDCDGC